MVKPAQIQVAYWRYHEGACDGNPAACLTRLNRSSSAAAASSPSTTGAAAAFPVVRVDADRRHARVMLDPWRALLGAPQQRVQPPNRAKRGSGRAVHTGDVATLDEAEQADIVELERRSNGLQPYVVVPNAVCP